MVSVMRNTERDEAMAALVLYGCQEEQDMKEDMKQDMQLQASKAWEGRRQDKKIRS